jgi:hypothetical protein
MDCNKKTIWSFAQNKPSLVVKDIIEKYPEVDPDFIYKVLLQRGVFKWLSVRRQLIKLKDTMRDEVKKLNHRKTAREKGYHEALIKCRADIRKLCHSERWVAPDFDEKAKKYLTKLET